jgi:hypothetical protein
MSLKNVFTFFLCFVFIIPILIGIGTSTEVDYVQASKSHPFRVLVGKKCDLNRQWFVYGWASFDNAKEIGSYQLRELDNTSNRHILLKEKLATNTLITVTDVYQSNSLFINEVRLHLSVANFPHVVHFKIDNIEQFCSTQT